MRHTRSLFRSLVAIVLSLGLAGAHAALINLDLHEAGVGERFGPGAAVFGSASSEWNYRSRLGSAANVNLLDDAGAATGVSISYDRINSGSAQNLTGTFSNLLTSHIWTSTVTLSGLIPDAFYDLVVFTYWNGTPSFLAGGVTQSSSRGPTNVDALTQGSQYVRFLLQASSTGVLQFTPQPNPSGTQGVSAWSGLQLRTSPHHVPEPGSLLLVLVAAGAGVAAAAARRKARSR
jgi:hypothetical protein